MKREIIQILSELDGLSLEVLTISPENQIKGIIQISHGMAEHKERYIPFMEYMAQKGYVAVIHDHRGHGNSIKSKEDLGYFYDETAEHIVEDLHQITQWIKTKYPNQPITLLGHSMGSMVVRKYIKKYDSKINKLIICGSPSKNPFTGLAIILTKMIKKIKGEHYRSKFIQKLAFGSYNKKFQNGISENKWICSDVKVVENYDQDKLCGFTFTTNGFINLFTLMKEIYQKHGWQLKNKDLSILFIAGSDDPVIISKEKWEQSQKFLSKVGYKNIKQKLYEKMRHEILNESGKELVWKDIILWIER